MPQATDLQYEESADTRMASQGAGESAETSPSCCGWGLGLGWAGKQPGGYGNWRCLGSKIDTGGNRGRSSDGMVWVD